VNLRILPLAAAVAVLVGTGVAHGLRTDRWGLAAELKAATDRLAKLPTKAGEWEGRDMPMDQRQLHITQASGHNSQLFVHHTTGQQAALLVLCGRPAPLSNHTPDVCLAGSGFRMEGEPLRQKVEAANGVSGEFWTAAFVREVPHHERMRVWWAWRTADQWEATNSPRVQLALRPVAYKLYVVSADPNPHEDLRDDPGRKLLETLLPEIQAALAQ
jgi:hypothetical protein